MFNSHRLITPHVYEHCYCAINMETNVLLPLPLAQHTNSQLLERLAGTTHRNTRKYLHGMG